MTDHVTEALSQAIIGSKPSAEAVAIARTAIVDFLACALGGAYDLNTRLVSGSGGSCQSVVLSCQRGTAHLLAAAPLHVFAARVRDYHDV